MTRALAVFATSTLIGAASLLVSNEVQAQAYPVVDTGQDVCYDDSGAIGCPATGASFHGQDAQYDGNQPSYTVSIDGLTVYDNVTGLTWTQTPDLDDDGYIDIDDKLTYAEAMAYPATLNALNYGGYDDWRTPSIKELYSLIDFRGEDPSGYSGTDPTGLVPFIDTDYFAFGYGDTGASERLIDAQMASSTLYVGNTANDGGQTLFGVNFADGRIKGYGLTLFGADKTFYVYFVRGNTDYGENQFVDNADGTITDNATQLMWSRDDSGVGMNWEDTLAWVQQRNDISYLGYDDWRLPEVKELHSILDYTRSPSTTSSAAIDPLFNVSTLTAEDQTTDYPFYWSGTTHANWLGGGGSAAYLCFGKAFGYMSNSWVDVHGAGAQRSDPKDGDPANWPTGNGPQGDAIRIFNYARAVRNVPEPSTTVSLIVGALTLGAMARHRRLRAPTGTKRIRPAFDSADRQRHAKLRHTRREVPRRALPRMKRDHKGWNGSSACASAVVIAAGILMLNGCSKGSDSSSGSSTSTPAASFVVVDTFQSICYSDLGATIVCGTSFNGQDAEYSGNAPSYTDNGDGTVTDDNTGLMWSAITINDVDYDDAVDTADASSYADYEDWRVPTIKELYSLIDFSGATGSGLPSGSSAPVDAVPFIDTTYFDHEYASSGSRYIDSQYLTTALYVDLIFDDDDSATDGEQGFFGVNFADGRIKGYETETRPGQPGKNLRLVRGTEAFENEFVDNGDMTITDSATGLMWMQQDSGSFTGTAGTQGDGSVDWPEALSWCEGLTLATHSDWRLPNAKELQSIVDYSKAPDITGTAAIDDVFSTTSILDPEGDTDYPMFWSSTSHVEGDATKSVYIAFGEAQGRFNTATQATGAAEPLLDVHGAGAQRSDPKVTSGGTFPDYQGPQGDLRRVYNFARCVRL